VSRLTILIVAALCWSPNALAQDYDGGLNAHGFVLTSQDGDIRDHYTVQRPGAMNTGEWFLGGIAEYANKPLVLMESVDGEVSELDAALTHVGALNLTAGYTPYERFRLGVSAPIYLTSTSFSESQGASIGDVRIDAMIVAAAPGENDSDFGVGVVPWVDLPTGDTTKYLGRGGVGGGAAVVGTYEMDQVTLTGNLGVQLDPKTENLENLTGSDSLLASLGANYLIDEVSSVGIEGHLAAPFDKNARAGTGTPAELIGSYRRVTDSGGFFSGGVALPVSRGAGAAAFRLFIGGGFGKIGPAGPKDLDLDGITDDLDACIDQPETVNNYIDEDGCPDELSTLNVTVTYDGAPVEGAELHVLGPDVDDKSLTAATPWSRQVIPDTSWSLEARKGECLAGDAKTLVGTGTQEAKVELQLVPSATLKIFVHDQSGKPIPNAELAWESDQPDCLPLVTPPLGSDGRGLAEVGAGKHRLAVSAPGYRIVEVPVVVQAGDDMPVDVTLQATKLKVTASKIVILEKVQFETAKAVILPQSYELLNEVADVVRRNPKAGRVEVQGHTDSRGSDTYNLDLSQRRSEAVRKYLIAQGVDKDRLIAVGYGESSPIDSNDTSKGRAQNRRVEFLLIDQKSQSIEEPVEP
jgi:outer membrane protein OmpA-like peptidoglycan-associated protein